MGNVDESLARELAERILTQEAPEELDMLPTTSRRYFADPKWMSGKDRGDGALAFDAGLLVGGLLTPIALVAATQVTQYVVAKFLDRGLPATGRAIRRLFRLPDDASEVDPPEDQALTLTDSEWAEIRQIVKSVAERGGVQPGLAETIADAVVGQGRLAGGPR
jgi:hypothetical protein